MNKVILMGRLTRDPDVRYTQGEEPMAIARFTLAVDRRGKRDGEASADFPSCVCFRRTAEFIEKYAHQGTKLVVVGRIQTGKLHKPGRTESIYDRCGRGRSRVCREQGGSRSEHTADTTIFTRYRSRRLYEHTGRNRRRATVQLGDNDGRQMRDVWRNHTGGKNGVTGM